MRQESVSLRSCLRQISRRDERCPEGTQNPYPWVRFPPTPQGAKILCRSKGSNPSLASLPGCWNGRQPTLKMSWGLSSCGFESHLGHLQQKQSASWRTVFVIKCSILKIVRTPVVKQSLLLGTAYFAPPVGGRGGEEILPRKFGKTAPARRSLGA